MPPEQLTTKLKNFLQRRVTVATKNLSQGRTTSELPVYYPSIEAIHQLPDEMAMPERLGLIDQIASMIGLERSTSSYSWDLPESVRKSIEAERQEKLTKARLKSEPLTRRGLASSDIPCQPQKPTVIKGYIPPRTPRHVRDSDGSYGEDPTYHVDDT